MCSGVARCMWCGCMHACMRFRLSTRGALAYSPLTQPHMYAHGLIPTAGLVLSCCQRVTPHPHCLGQHAGMCSVTYSSPRVSPSPHMHCCGTAEPSQAGEDIGMLVPHRSPRSKVAGGLTMSRGSRASCRWGGWWNLAFQALYV